MDPDILQAIRDIVAERDQLKAELAALGGNLGDGNRANALLQVTTLLKDIVLTRGTLARAEAPGVTVDATLDAIARFEAAVAAGAKRLGLAPALNVVTPGSTIANHIVTQGEQLTKLTAETKRLAGELVAQRERVINAEAKLADVEEELEKRTQDRNRWRHDYDEVQAMLRQLANRVGQKYVNATASCLVRDVYSQIDRVWTTLDSVADAKIEHGEIGEHVKALADLYSRVCRQLAQQTVLTSAIRADLKDADGNQVTPEQIKVLKEQNARLSLDVANKATELFVLRMKVKSLESEQERNRPFGPLRPHNPFTPPEDGASWPAPYNPWPSPLIGGGQDPYPGWPHRIYIGDPINPAGGSICMIDTSDTGMVCGTGGSGGVHPCAKGCNNPDQGCDDLGCSTKPNAITDTPSTGC